MPNKEDVIIKVESELIKIEGVIRMPLSIPTSKLISMKFNEFGWDDPRRMIEEVEINLLRCEGNIEPGSIVLSSVDDKASGVVIGITNNIAHVLWSVHPKTSFTAKVP